MPSYVEFKNLKMPSWWVSVSLDLDMYLYRKISPLGEYGWMNSGGKVIRI
jgi:hypothetical protein